MPSPLSEEERAANKAKRDHLFAELKRHIAHHGLTSFADPGNRGVPHLVFVKDWKNGRLRVAGWRDEEDQNG